MFLRIGRGVSINLMSGFTVQEWSDGSFTLFPPQILPGGLQSVDVPPAQHDAVAKTLNECGWRGKYEQPPPDRPTQEELMALAREAQRRPSLVVPPAGANLSHMR